MLQSILPRTLNRAEHQDTPAPSPVREPANNTPFRDPAHEARIDLPLPPMAAPAQNTQTNNLTSLRPCIHSTRDVGVVVLGSAVIFTLIGAGIAFIPIEEEIEGFHTETFAKIAIGGTILISALSFLLVAFGCYIRVPDEYERSTADLPNRGKHFTGKPCKACSS